MLKNFIEKDTKVKVAEQKVGELVRTTSEEIVKALPKKIGNDKEQKDIEIFRKDITQKLPEQKIYNDKEPKSSDDIFNEAQNILNEFIKYVQNLKYEKSEELKKELLEVIEKLKKARDAVKRIMSNSVMTNYRTLFEKFFRFFNTDKGSKNNHNKKKSSKFAKNMIATLLKHLFKGSNEEECDETSDNNTEDAGKTESVYSKLAALFKIIKPTLESAKDSVLDILGQCGKCAIDILGSICSGGPGDSGDSGDFGDLGE